MKVIRNIAILFLLFTICSVSVFAAETNGTSGSIERYALYVASNRGGEDRETLKYAGTDAESLAKTMIEIGGVRKQNSFILVDSTREEIEGAFDNITSIIERNKYKAKRVEFLFYYSGHSDEEALLLGNEKYGYSDLKSDISNVPSDIHVVMLDSCFSGNFIRAKGGSRQKSFLVDDASVVQGHAYLSSSSESESSQESDVIGASYFTHSLITGLRGAADTSGDNRVSLNELYYYAFNDTLAKTETSVIGPQHPSFNITLVGSGDLVLTDLSDAEAMIILPSDAEGRYLVRTLDGRLASEVNKVRGSQLSIALPAGYYTVTVVTANSTGQTNVRLIAGNSFTLASDGIKQVPLTTGVARGGAVLSGNVSGDAANVAAAGAMAGTAGTAGAANVAGTAGIAETITSIVGDTLEAVGSALSGAGADLSGVSGNSASRVFGYDNSSLDTEERNVLERARKNAARNSKTTSYDDDDYDYNTTSERSGYGSTGSGNGATTSSQVDYDPISISVFPGFSIPAEYDNVNIAIGSLYITNERIRGFQVSGLIGSVKQELSGIQVSGLLSKLGGIGSGIMVGGLLNNTKGTFRGVQYAGLGNFVTGDMRGSQVAGFINKVSGSLQGMQIAGFINIAGNVQGSQIGIVNIADSCSGASIGIFNYIKNGINSFSMFYENKDFGIQYQGGTKTFFTTFLTSAITPNKKENKNYFVMGYGIGTQIGGSFINFDIEVLSKYILDIDHVRSKFESLKNIDDSETDNAGTVLKDTFSEFSKRFYPSARVTANMRFGNHFGIFASFNADLRVNGWNDKVFDYWSEKAGQYDFPIHDNPCSVRTYWTFGIKL
ncbi:MAG: caspase family protein [Treponemataceae bacterium]|nr:caspase family protein [Treponemataceae bacterium]